MVGFDLCSLDTQDFLVTVYSYSDYWEVDHLKRTTSREVIDKLQSHFGRHGSPDKVLTDNGPQFTSTEFAEFAKSWDFEH